MQFHQNPGSWRQGLSSHLRVSASGPRAARPHLRASASKLLLLFGPTQTTATSRSTAGNQEEQLIDHGVARREHGETRRETRKSNIQLTTAVARHKHGFAPKGSYRRFRFRNSGKRRATVVNGSTETDWQRKTAKALIIEAVLENGLGAPPSITCGCGFFRCAPFQSVRSIPLPKAFPLFRLIVVFPPCATTEKHRPTVVNGSTETE
jgi:hypothetical protein